MLELPTGTVTFLFSDIEGSTRLLRELGDRWEEALAAHNRILRESFAEAGGREVDRQGDAFFAVFARARDAVAAAGTAQQALARHEWPDGADVRVRMGIHTGEPSVGGEGYLGVDVVRAARICSAANGGQVLVSESTRALVGGSDLEDIGVHQLKDMEQPERLFQLVVPGLPHARPAPRGIEHARGAAPEQLVRRLEGLGPAIERQVQDALARAPIPPARRREIDRRLGQLEQLEQLGTRAKPPVKAERVFLLAGFVVLVTFAAVVAIVYLIVQAL
jgi:class 3 adenylate cyclase